MPLTASKINAMPADEPKHSRFTALAQYLGLAHGPAGRSAQRGFSRYGRMPGKRLDEDIDDLRARIAALEARAGDR